MSYPGERMVACWSVRRPVFFFRTQTKAYSYIQLRIEACELKGYNFFFPHSVAGIIPCWNGVALAWLAGYMANTHSTEGVWRYYGKGTGDA